MKRKFSVAMCCVVVAGSVVMAPATSVSAAPSAPTTASVSAAKKSTKSCSTGGYWYMTDSLYVTQTYVGGSYPWKYSASFSKTRRVWYNKTPIDHVAYLLNRYHRNGVTGWDYPSSPTDWWSTSSTEDVGMFWNVYPSGGPKVPTRCYVYF